MFTTVSAFCLLGDIMDLYKLSNNSVWVKVSILAYA